MSTPPSKGPPREPLPHRVPRPGPARRQHPNHPPLPRSLQPKRVDTSSPDYKRAARKYVSFMVALPVLLVTSYVLFDRLVIKTPAKTLHREPLPLAERLEKEDGSSTT